MKKFLLILTIFCYASLFSQVGIGTTDLRPGSSLQIDGENSGVLINRVSLNALNDTTTVPSLDDDDLGMMVFNINTSSNVDSSLDVVPGFYFWNGSSWLKVTDAVDISTIAGDTKGWVALTDNSTSFTTITGFSTTDIANNLGWVKPFISFLDDGDTSIETFSPAGFTSSDFFDSTTSKITPLKLGDSYLLRIQFDALPQDNNSYLVMRVNIGTTLSPIVIFQKTIPLLRGSGSINNVSESVLLYALNTFMTNGANIEFAYSVSSGGTGTSVKLDQFNFVIQRL